ncbi:MAG TPA: hypothetical protein VFY12_08390 [Arenimonas sp.]|nr:hypothetical protein [Arenimonas sp.]
MSSSKAGYDLFTRSSGLLGQVLRNIGFADLAFAAPQCGLLGRLLHNIGFADPAFAAPLCGLLGQQLQLIGLVLT